MYFYPFPVSFSWYFLPCLFSDTLNRCVPLGTFFNFGLLSSSDYMASSNRIINNLEKSMEKNLLWSKFNVLSWLLPGGTEEIVLPLGWDLSWHIPKTKQDCWQMGRNFRSVDCWSFSAVSIMQKNCIPCSKADLRSSLIKLQVNRF
jgi:hypothetical protein